MGTAWVTRIISAFTTRQVCGRQYWKERQFTSAWWACMDGILVVRCSPTTSNRSHGSKTTSKAAESSTSSSDAASTNASSPFRSYHAPSGPGIITVGGRHRKVTAGVPHAISLSRWSAPGGWSCIHRKERSTAVVGRIKCTSQRRPKHSQFLILFSSFPILANSPLGSSVVRAARGACDKHSTVIELPSDYKKRYRVAEVVARADE